MIASAKTEEQNVYRGMTIENHGGDGWCWHDGTPDGAYGGCWGSEEDCREEIDRHFGGPAQSAETFTFMGKTLPKMTAEQARENVATMQKGTKPDARQFVWREAIKTDRLTEEAKEVYRQALKDDGVE